MDTHNLLQTFLHLDKTLADFTTQYGPQTYTFLFAIVFCETGLVILPFLPGDSLLFAAGAVSAGGSLNAAVLYPLFVIAALMGDNLNYAVGRFGGRRLFQSETSKVFKRSNLVRTEAFFAKHGGKAIIMARFVPVVRTFAPFVAGMSDMPYGKFLAYSVAGALLWVGVCVTAGLLFGQIPAVTNNFQIVVIGIILVSLLPLVFEAIAHRKAQAGGDAAR